MRNFKHEIDGCDDPNELRELLAELSTVIEQLDDRPYEDDAHLDRIHEMELLLQYGELKFTRLLA